MTDCSWYGKVVSKNTAICTLNGRGATLAFVYSVSGSLINGSPTQSRVIITGGLITASDHFHTQVVKWSIVSIKKGWKCNLGKALNLVFCQICWFPNVHCTLADDLICCRCSCECANPVLRFKGKHVGVRPHCGSKVFTKGCTTASGTSSQLLICVYSILCVKNCSFIL